MPRSIKEGDIVDVHWADGEVLRCAEIVYMPTATGDLMYIKAIGGDMYGINTSGSKFDCIIKWFKI